MTKGAGRFSLERWVTETFCVGVILLFCLSAILIPAAHSAESPSAPPSPPSSPSSASANVSNPTTGASGSGPTTSPTQSAATTSTPSGPVPQPSRPPTMQGMGPMAAPDHDPLAADSMIPTAGPGKDAKGPRSDLPSAGVPVGDLQGSPPDNSPAIEPPPPEITDSTADEPVPKKKKKSHKTALSKKPIKRKIEIPPDDAIRSDEENEQRFSLIYQNFSQQLGDEKWAQIVGDKASETYTLQQGDNLWDISTQLFGDGFYWPKVWQLNDEITNPHLITTGRILRFSPGTDTTPPSVGVDITQNISQATSDSEVGDNEVEPAFEYDTIITSDTPEGNQVLIPPGKKSRRVLSRIPPSFPETNRTFGEYDRKTGFAKGGLKRYEPKIVAGAIPSIVVEDVWSPDGKIIEMEADASVATTYQDIIIRLSGDAKRGDYFTVFSTNGKVTDPTTNYTIGMELETRAEIEIVEPIDGSNNTYRAIVMNMALPVRLGDSLKYGRLITRANFEASKVFASVPARIVNGEGNKREVLGLHAVVFLDKGTKDGVQLGSMMNIIKNVSTRNSNTKINYDPRPIGRIKMVEVEPHVSTAIIISENDAVLPGDMTEVVESEKGSVSPDEMEEVQPEDKILEDNSD